MIYNVRQQTSTASCIDILATSPLCCTGSCPRLLQNWVFWRRQGSRAKSFSRAEPRQQPWKYSSYRGLGSISPKILLIGRPKIALVFFRIKIRGNSTWYPVKTIQFTSYLSVWQHIKIAVYDVTCNTYIDMLLRYILYSMTLHIICYIIYYIIKKKYYIVGVIS